MVGGCIRDQFLGVKPKDFDFAVEAESFDCMRNAVIAKGGEIFLEQPAYLTIRARIPEYKAADFVLCRKESHYIDGRHPENVSVGTIFDDLARRDFRMNAIAKNIETNEVIDPSNGLKDIIERVIRAVGNPIERFEEDRLRILRAFRFAIQLGFSIDESVDSAIKEISDRNEAIFRGVSDCRIREELFKMFRVSTLKTLDLLGKYPKVSSEIFADGKELWLRPTLESKL